MTVFDFKVKNRDGDDVSLSDFKGKVLMIVNTATGCGFTPQYDELGTLYRKYHDKGLEILDFPCNQFGKQAPGSNEEIHNFCTLKYDVSFDQFAKVDVNGENEIDLYKYLKNEINNDTVERLNDKMTMLAIKRISNSVKEEKDIKWNFTKFLVDRNGDVVGRYAPTYTPKKMETKIKELLAA